MAKIFDGAVIAVSGTHKGYTQAKIEKLVKTNGGTFVKTVDDDTTHLITTEVDIAKQSNKVTQALAQSIPLVALEWLTTSIENKKREAEKEHELSAEDVKTDDVKMEDVKAKDEEDASPEPEPVTNGRGSKRRVAVRTKVEPEEEEEPPAKKTKKAPAAKGKKGKAVKDEEEEEEEDEEPAEEPKKAGKGKKGKAVKAEDEEEDEEPAEEPKKAAKGKKGKAAAKAEEPKEEPKKEPKMKTVIRKGKAPVDEYSGLQSSHHVYVDDNSGVVFDACLNQTNLGANNNKFYNIQLLESDNGKTYSTFTHWGRVGEKGQNKMLCQGASFPTAEAAFDKQFKTKTGKYWADRANAHGGSSKYAYLERNYEDDEEDASTGSSDPSTAPKIPESTIAKPLQELVKLIFNTKIMEQSMASMSYDANKLPLGKLSKETITRGYLVLKEIGAVISDPAYPNKKNRLDELAGQYYTVIPHDFGRQRPTSISTAQALKQETELIEALTDLKITAEIMASTKQAHDINPLDNQFNSLNLNEAEPLDHTSSEFKLLEAYLHKTHGATHHMTLRVEEIFRITRSSEIDRWDAAGFGSIPNSNRKLLWHGSRTTNYSGILSQGLRIAPPEAPVSGYMFDKGIYLADIATKSANYCYAGASDNTGLLMLCEAQLGDPMLELTRAAYDAATLCKNAGALATKGLGRVAPLQWEDAGAVNKQLKGVTMPKVSGSEKTIVGDAKVTGAGLQYNEYIVYNVNQVKIRYLFRCKFGN